MKSRQANYSHIDKFKRIWNVIGFREALVDLLWRVIRRITHKKRHYVHLTDYPNPICMRYDSSDYAMCKPILMGDEYRCLDDIDAKFILDCGANVGFSSIYFLNRYPLASVIAVEPDRDNIRICMKNLSHYGSRAKVVQAGIWSRKTGLVFAGGLGGDNSECAITVRDIMDGEKPDVCAIDVSSLLEEKGITQIDILKIDIEGSEKEMFTNNFKQWLPLVRNIAIELHGRECEEAYFHALRNYTYDLTKHGDLTVCRNLERIQIDSGKQA